MSYAAILFDLDGTLVDTITLYERAFLQTLKEFGADVPLKTFQEWYMQGRHLRDIASSLGICEENIPQVRLRRDMLYEELLATETEWLPGALEALDTAKAIAPIGIVTGSWLSYLEAMRPRVNVFPYADTLVTADDIHAFMKPHPHGLFLAADRLHVDPKECIYIGDQSFDVEAANAAGMASCLFIGKHTPENAAEGAMSTTTTLKNLSQLLR